MEIVDGVPSEYLEASRKSLNDEQQFRAFEAAVRSLYKQMARISHRAGVGEGVGFRDQATECRGATHEPG